MARKINSEFTVDNEYFKIKIGTTDRKNPKTIYFDYGFFIEPKIEKNNYSEEIESIETKAKMLAKIIPDRIIVEPNSESRMMFKKDFIFVFDIAESRVFYGKKTYLSIQIHLKQGDKILNFTEIKDRADSFTNYFTNELKANIDNIGFNISKTKK